MLRVESVQIRDLESCAEKFINEATNQQITPITMSRAVAQQCNPQARPDDVGLIVVYDGDVCVGHVGLIPGILRYGNDRIPISWSHALYVMPEYRRTAAAFLLMKKLTSLDRDILVTGFNSGSYELCKAFGFKDLGELSFLTVDLQKQNLFGKLELARASLLARWKRRRGGTNTKEFKPSILYRFLKNRYLAAMSRRSTELILPYRWTVSDHLRQQVCDKADNELTFERNIETINWMILYPWLVEGKGVDKPPFVFSHRRPIARYVPIEIYDDHDGYMGSAVFFVTVKHGNKVVRLLDHSSGRADLPYVAIAAQVAHLHRADQLFFPIELDRQVQQLFPSSLISRKKRKYQWLPKNENSESLEIIERGHSIALQYANGDCGHI